MIYDPFSKRKKKTFISVSALKYAKKKQFVRMEYIKGMYDTIRTAFDVKFRVKAVKATSKII